MRNNIGKIKTIKNINSQSKFMLPIKQNIIVRRCGCLYSNCFSYHSWCEQGFDCVVPNPYGFSRLMADDLH